MSKLANEMVRTAFSIAEVARAYGISPATVRLEIRAGRLRALRFGRRRIVVTHTALHEYLAGREERGTERGRAAAGRGHRKIRCEE